ncbi:uncharacterized protein BJ212DRAFT_1401823 [Suillus subaureus]|uniref:Uncharacterized protein n=1 Tax=Suillus subaureus TaxID=48587 RepID=A0A9P7DP37_9AGAM|nr:uncharacterized protein BJ212DRAFT_1401823 [Suillus subaureus]KAG1799576.1 hypothetical protein BJ212DRAFT_1401823 [Suillus subaureus]
MSVVQKNHLKRLQESNKKNDVLLDNPFPRYPVKRTKVLAERFSQIQQQLFSTSEELSDKYMRGPQAKNPEIPRIHIITLHRRFVEVQLLNNFESHCIPRTTFTFNPYRSGCTVNHKQFSLRLAYATTFNGCQELILLRLVDCILRCHA